MFTINEYQALLSVIFESFNLFNNLIIAKGFPDSIFIGYPEAAILTVIGAPVSDIKRSKKHYPVTVYFFFKFSRSLPYLISQIRTC